MKAEIFVALAEAVVADGFPVGVRPWAGAEVVAIHAGALSQRRELALAVGLEAEIQDFFRIAVVEDRDAGGVLPLQVFKVFGVEPALLRHVRGGLGQRTAETLALFLVEILVVAPVVVEADEPAHIFDGAEVAIGAFGDFGDGVGDLLLLFGRGQPRGARHGAGNDLAGVEDFAGASRVDAFGEEALDHLRAEDADGVEIFEDREGDVEAAREDEAAIFRVRIAEVLAEHGAGGALASGHSEGAAADGGRAQDGVGGDGVRGGGHAVPFRALRSGQR